MFDLENEKQITMRGVITLEPEIGRGPVNLMVTNKEPCSWSPGNQRACGWNRAAS